MRHKDIFMPGYQAIRNSVAYTVDKRICCILLSGENALDALDTICPCDVFLQEGQMKHTMLLTEKGIPLADIYISREGYNAYILGYVNGDVDLQEWIVKHTEGMEGFMIQNISQTHTCLNLDGPYSWELGAEVFGSDILGLPYLGMMEMDTLVVFRAGRTGEYGYHFMVPTEDKDQWLDKIKSIGGAYQLGQANEEILDFCALENFFFDITKEGAFELNPMELQLQWRISSQKTAYPGAGQLQQLKKEGWGRRIVSFVSPNDLNINAPITHDGETIGKVLGIGYSPVRGDYVGKALMNKPFWHAGLDGIQAEDTHIETISAPAIDNLSLKISPYRDSFHSRKEDLS